VARLTNDVAGEQVWMRSRILIVDDDGPQRRSLCLGLSLAGFAAEEVGTGDQALAKMEMEDFDLAIVDLMMPGMSGVELVRRMQFRHPALPVVLTSGYHLGRQQVERVGLNTIAFVPKPFNLDELCQFLSCKLTPPARGAVGATLRA
jgi:DNA-binding NtrC family response regulator